MTATTNEKLLEALDYAARGWQVLPLHTPMPGGCSCGLATCTSVGKHPRHDSVLIPDGVKSATINPNKIRNWWWKWPDANVGIATGRGSNLLVLDVDPAHGGADSLEDLIEHYGRLPETVEVLTGGGGRHLYFVHPGIGVKNNNSGKLGPGLDVKSDGGYIVAPPSLHASGRYYEWEASSHPQDVNVAPLPQWLFKLLTQPTAPSPTRPGANGNGNGNGQAGPAPAIGERIPDGARNATLTSIAGSMRRRGASEAAICAALLEENRLKCVPPLDDEEVRRIARSVSRYEPFRTDRGTPLAVPADIARAPFTDTGNAEVMQSLYGDRMRYDWRRGRWLLWLSGRWQTDPNGELIRMVETSARARLRAAAGIEDENERKHAVSWSMASENMQRINATLARAQSLEQIADSGDGWDADPMLLGCTNGVVDLRTGTLRPAQPGDKITLSTGIAFDPDAKAPRWNQFLEEVFKNDPDLILFMQRAAGYSLTGNVQEQCLFLCYGGGANGKSTLLNVLRQICGDYSANTPFNTFELGESRNSATNDLAALCGRRLVTASETAEAQRLNEARVKAITGNDPLTARFLHKEFFTYIPTFKVWLAVNHKPKVTGTDDGIWRRLKPIPFLVSFKGREDKTLSEDLRAELPGVLAWAVRGALMWQAMGLQDPPAVTDAAESYRNESDIVYQWVEDRCILKPGVVTSAAELYRDFKAWIKSNGEAEMSSRQFGMELSKRRDLVRDRRSFGVVYVGIGLLTDDNQGVQSGMM